MDINEYDLMSLIGIYTFLTSLFWGKRIIFRPSISIIWKHTNIDEYQLVSSKKYSFNKFVLTAGGEKAIIFKPLNVILRAFRH
jgi:hypothetical protein